MLKRGFPGGAHASTTAPEGPGNTPGCRRCQGPRFAVSSRLRRTPTRQKGGDPIPAHPYKPGQTVPSTAVYNLVDENNQYTGRQETHEQGNTFPQTRGGNERAYKLYQIAKKSKSK